MRVPCKCLFYEVLIKYARGKCIKNVSGGILGVAVGDAMGVPVKFISRQEIAKNPVVSMREYGT